MFGHCLARRQAGQAMIEYMVVLAFAVIVLIKPFSFDDVNNPNATADQGPPLKQVATAIKDYHKHYSYAMSIAYIPDCDYQLALDKSSSLADIAGLTGNVAVGVDRCIDWTNPQFPALSVTGSLTFNIVSDVGAAVEKIITDTIKDSIDGFLDPSSLFGSAFSFKPSDFF
jgi:hypothetical protein